MTTTQPTFDQYLTSWKYAVAGQKHAPLPVEIVAESVEQFEQWQRRMGQVKIDANKAGYACQFNKGGSSARKAAWVVSKGFTLKVVYTAKAKRPQAVTATSREAYHTVNLGERCKEVAREAIKRGVVSDNEIARALGMVPSSVSARRNDIENAGAIVVDGTTYFLTMQGTRIDEVTKRRVNTWALLSSDRERAYVDSKPAESPVQASLFQ